MRVKVRSGKLRMDFEVDERIAQIAASLAMEGLDLQEKSKEDIRAVLSGVTPADEIVKQIQDELKVKMGFVAEEVQNELQKTREHITETMASVTEQLRKNNESLANDLADVLEGVNAELEKAGILRERSSMPKRSDKNDT